MDARDAKFKELVSALIQATTTQLTAISSVPVQLVVREVGGFDPRAVRGLFTGQPIVIQVGWATEEQGVLIFVERAFLPQAAGAIAGKEGPLDLEDRGDRAELEGMIRLSLDAAGEALRELAGQGAQFGAVHLSSEGLAEVSSLTGFFMTTLDVSVGELASRVICLAAPRVVSDMLGGATGETATPTATPGPEQVRVRPGAFTQLEEQTYAVGSNRSLDLLMDLELPVSVELGRVNMTIRGILGLGPGAVVELDKFSGEPVDLLVNNKKFAEGEVVVVDQNFGVRITALVGANERLNAAREGRSE